MFCDEILDLGEGADVSSSTAPTQTAAARAHGPRRLKVIRNRLAPETTIVLTHMSGTPILNGMTNTLIAEDLKTFRF